MTLEEIETAKKLSFCRFFPATSEKRFVRCMASIAVQNPEYELTEKQKAFLMKIKHRYRKQLALLSVHK